MESRQLHPVDWVLFAVLLIVSLGIGVFYSLTGGRQKTTKEFLLANRKLRVIPTALSMYVSSASAIAVLGRVAEVYLHGPQVFVSIIGFAGSVTICAVIWVPLFYKLQLTSGYQYLNRRYESGKLRLLSVLLSIGYNALHNGLALYAASTALEAVSGFPWWAGLILAGLVSTTYTIMGGMKAVVGTDVLQACIMFGGLLVVLIIGTNRAGGVSNVFDKAREGGRLNFFNFNPDPTVRMSFWSLIIGQLFFDVAGMAVGQAFIQRYCALPTLTKARLSILLSFPISVFLGTVLSYLGLVVYAYFANIGCDPLRSGIISNANQILPYFVSTVLNIPGVTGLFLAALYSAALSTSSSNLSSQSALCWKDIIEPRIKKIPEHRKAMVTKVLVFIFGVTAIGIGLLGHVLPGHIMEVARRAIGTVTGPLQGVFILAVFFPFANAGGAVSGIVGAVALVMWINIGSYITRPHQATLNTTVANCSMPPNTTVFPVPTDPPAGTIFPLYRISFMWITSLSTATCIIIGLVVSLALGGSRRWSVDARLLIPISNYCCFFLPKSVRRFFWCGVDYDHKPSGEINLDEEQEKKVSDAQQEQMKEIPVVSKQVEVPHTSSCLFHRQNIHENTGFECTSVDSTKL